MKWDSKILILGYGSVAQCTLPLLLKHIEMDRNKMTIIDFEDKSKVLANYCKTGIRFVQMKITKDNLVSVLDKHAGKNALIIDLAWNIGVIDLLLWCNNNDTLYVNTSVELWDPYKSKSLFEKTLYYRQMEINTLKEKFKPNSITAILDHGANPGLISHFVKKGLFDIADKVIIDEALPDEILEQVTRYKRLYDFPNLARVLNVKVIHCSERDTQVTNAPKQVNEFVNTWSIEGFREEGIAPVELGWGTHEKKLPISAIQAPVGPRNQIFLPQMGINTKVKSFVPEIGTIEGMAVRHGESFSISDRLTVWEDHDHKHALYRPTVTYAYMPCHEALSSLEELRSRNYELQPSLRIMNDEIVSGKDILGALLMGHPYQSWFTGSILSIEQSRELVPGNSATTVQVAAGITAAVMYMLENPNKGILLPDDVPFEFILDIAEPYLGELHSQAYDWNPLSSRKVFFETAGDSDIEITDPWQFECFRPLL